MTGPICWLVSYPKSGNTWLRFLLESLLTGGGPIDINRRQVKSGIARTADLEELFGIEASDLTAAEIMATIPDFHRAVAADADRSHVLRKVHDRFWNTTSGEPAFPAAVSRGAIYIARDPRDVAVSYAHHRGRSIDDIIALMGDEETMLGDWERDRFSVQLPQPLGSWSSHVLSWMDQPDIPVHLVRYEDLHADPAAGLTAIARHLGLDPSARVVAAAVDAASFPRLRAQELAGGFTERRAHASAPFFRSGRPGDGCRQLTSDQSRRILDRHGAVMARLGYS